MRKKGKYVLEDLVDEFVLGKLSEHVDFSRLGDFARKLNVSEDDRKKIAGSTELSQKQQIEQVG